MTNLNHGIFSQGLPPTIDAAFDPQSPRTSTPTALETTAGHENAFDSTKSNFATTNSDSHNTQEPIEDEIGSREQKALAILNASFENEDGFDSSLPGETDSQTSCLLVTQTGSVETTEENPERGSLPPTKLATTNVAPDETNGTSTPSQQPEGLPHPPEDSPAFHSP